MDALDILLNAPSDTGEETSWRDWFAYLIRPVPWVSLGLSISVVAVLIAQGILLHQGLAGLHDWLFILDDTWLRHPWTLITSRFAHKGTPHLWQNLLGLIVLAPVAERLIGWRRFLLFYLAASIIAGLGGIWLEAERSAGASGGVFAVMGALIVLLVFAWARELAEWEADGWPWSVEGFSRWYVSPRVHEFLALAVVVFQLWGLAQWEPVTAIGKTGNVAHLTGLLTGLAYGLWLAWRGDALANLPR